MFRSHYEIRPRMGPNLMESRGFNKQINVLNTVVPWRRTVALVTPNVYRFTNESMASACHRRHGTVSHVQHSNVGLSLQLTTCIRSPRRTDRQTDRKHEKYTNTRV
jgi:hypothetical protein